MGSRKAQQIIPGPTRPKRGKRLDPGLVVEPRNQARTARQALLVLGMHRSGTSALAGVLGKLGARLPHTLMPANADNPRGYWESVSLMGFNDEILQSAGSRWSDWDQFNPRWRFSPIAEQFRARLPELIDAEFGDASLMVIKDPRISRFAPEWLDGLRALGIEPKVVITVRHPFEVASSLLARNHFGRTRGLLIWLRHLLEAEFATRQTVRSFVRYESLLHDWQAQAVRLSNELALTWPRWSSEVKLEIDQFLTSSMRHNRVEDTRGDVGEFANRVLAVHRVLGELAEGAAFSSEHSATLDENRAWLNSTGEIYGAALREQELIGEQLAERLNEVELGRDVAMRDLGAAQEILDARTAEIASWSEAARLGKAAQVAAFAKHEQALAEASDQLASATREMELRREQHRQSQASLQERTVELAQLGYLLLEAESAQLSVEAERDASATELEALRVDAQALGTRLEATLEQVQTLEQAGQALVQAHAEAVEAGRLEVEQLKRSNQASLDTLVAEHSTRIGELTAENSTRIAELTAENSTRIAELTAGNSTRVAQLTAENSTRIAELTAENSTRVAELTAGHAAQLAELNAGHEAQVLALELKLEELSKSAKREAGRVRQLELAAAREVLASDQRFSEIVHTHQTELAAAEQRAKRAVDVLQLELAARASRLEERAESHRRDRASHERALKALSEAHAAELNRLMLHEQELIASHRSAAAESDRRLASSQKLQQALVREIAMQVEAIAELGARIRQIESSRVWRYATALRKPRPGHEPSLEEQARILRGSGIMDVAWYLSRYPDVVDSGMDPVLHFLQFGAAEGRSPAPELESAEPANQKKFTELDLKALLERSMGVDHPARRGDRESA